MASRKKSAPTESVPPPSQPTVKIAKQEYMIKAVTELRLHPENPKKGKVGAIGESLEANDFYGAAVVQKSSGFILVGNHRYKAAIEKGLKEIPVIVIDCDDATARRIMLADNRIADLGTYDEKLLQANVQASYQDGGLMGTGFMGVDLERMLAKDKPPEKFPEFNEQVKVTYTCPKCKFAWSS